MMHVTLFKRDPTIRLIKMFWGLTPCMREITIGLEWVLGRYFEMAGKPSDFINYSRESGDGSTTVYLR